MALPGSSACPWRIGHREPDALQINPPALLNPALISTSHGDDSAEAANRIAARATRAWGRFWQAAVSAFAFVEVAGPVYGGKLVRDALGSAPNHTGDLAQAEAWLAAAARPSRAERAERLPGASGDDLTHRAADWAEIRPEWGLAGCGAFIVAYRTATTGRDLQGWAFLHSHDWKADKDFGRLELILTAPVAVASWISLKTTAQPVAPQAFVGGNKHVKDVVGGIGVVAGNGGLLRPGVPFQTAAERTASDERHLSCRSRADADGLLSGRPSCLGAGGRGAGR